ncbi:MAG: GDSL-type esterase/lipase family protein [Planctomycetaceae bacterium]|nr:GDSL-type esterase/lipase family protein [Planctomycetaceae bacterium]
MRHGMMSLAIGMTICALVFASPAAAATKVACAGDSITKGVGGGGQDYPKQLGALLGSDYVVGNYGASGRTVLPGRGQYATDKYCKQAMASKPDVVVIMLGTNDAKSATVDKEKFTAAYKALVKSFADLPSKPKIYICTPVAVGKDAYGITEKVVKEQVVPLVKQIAEDLKLPLIDCYTPTAGKADLYDDGVHPNAKGYAVIAQTVAEAIKAAPKASASPTEQAKAASSARPFPE